MQSDTVDAFMSMPPLLVMLAIGGGALLGGALTVGIRRWCGPATGSSTSALSAGPIVLLSALLCAYATWRYGVSLLCLSRIVFGDALIVLAATDLHHRRLPNIVTLPGIVLGLLFSIVTDPGWRASLLGIVAGGGVPWAIGEVYYRFRGQEGLGMGDVKMLAMIGAFLGWQPVLLTLALSSIAGSLAGIAAMARGRGGLQHTMPFGTFLAAGAALVAFVAPPVLDWIERSAR